MSNTIVAMTRPTVSRYLQPVPGFGTSGPQMLPAPAGWPRKAPWGDFNNEADDSAQGGVTYGIAVLKNRHTQDLDRYHFVLMQRLVALSREKPTVNEPLILSTLNLQLRQERRKYHSLRRILDQWLPMGYINNIYRLESQYSRQASEEMCNITIGNVERLVYNYWLSDDPANGEAVTRPGMHLFFLRKFVKVYAPQATEPDYADEPPLKRPRYEDSVDEWQADDGGRYLDDGKAPLKAIASGFTKGYCWQWVPWASAGAAPTFNELATFPDADGLPVIGRPLFVGISLIVHKITTEARKLHYKFVHQRDDPNWNDLLPKMGTLDILLKLSE